MAAPEVILYSKADCPFCDRAKAIFQRRCVSYSEIRVDQNDRDALASRYFSGSATVPQIFIGGYHIAGAEDLEALDAAGQLETILKTSPRGASLRPPAEEDLVRDASDFPLRDVITRANPTVVYDDENLVILDFYRGMFGFFPQTWTYNAQWDEAYRAAALCLVMTSLPPVAMTLGPETMMGIANSTSKAAGCTYCQIHTSTVGGDHVTENTRELEQAMLGNASDDGPYGDFEVAIMRLAQAAALNDVADGQVEEVRALASKARGAPRDQDAAVNGVAMICAVMGYLNVFNAMTSLRVEGGLAQRAAAGLNIDVGRHGALEADPDDLSHDFPDNELSIVEATERFDDLVGDPSTYMSKLIGLAPNWLAAWPELTRARFSYVYSVITGEDYNAELSSELKHHLMRVTAIARGFPGIAAAEALAAYNTSHDKARTVARLKSAYEIASGNTDAQDDLFDAKEVAALRLARVSALSPIVTVKRFVQPAIEAYSEKQLVELISTCALASAIQRLSAIMQPEFDEDARAFCIEHNIDLEVIALKYPLARAA